MIFATPRTDHWQIDHRLPLHALDDLDLTRRADRSIPDLYDLYDL